MQITKNSVETTAGRTEWFTRAVYVDTVTTPTGPSRLQASSVHFTPGARTAWHTHPNGQTIWVTEGVGLAQRRGDGRPRAAHLPALAGRDAGDAGRRRAGRPRRAGAGPRNADRRAGRPARPLGAQDRRPDRRATAKRVRARAALWGNVAVTQAYLTLSEVLGHVDFLLDRGEVREVEVGVVRYEKV
jgi:hypothetical protein